MALKGAREAVRSNGAVEQACAVARRFADDASGALASLDQTPLTGALAGLGHLLVDSLPR